LASDGEHYGLSKKTKHRKGEQMRRLALLSVVLMLASAVFAPVALAQEPGAIDVQSVELGPGGSVTVTGTIECVEGHFWNATVTVRQRTSGNVFNQVSPQTSGQCTATETITFTATDFSNRPFHRGPATVQPFNFFCDPSGSLCQNVIGELETVRIS
jgi:hypothetical protein